MESKKTAPKKTGTKKKSPTKSSKKVSKPRINIEAIPFDISYLDENGVEQIVHQDDEALDLAAQTWFAVTLPAPISRRFLHVLQCEDDSAFVLYLAADRDAAGTSTLRLPQAGAFLRALIKGTLHVLGADTLLSREQIAAHIGGHEPPPTKSKPPYV